MASHLCVYKQSHHSDSAAFEIMRVQIKQSPDSIVSDHGGLAVKWTGEAR
jgi:hypothetical protein